MIKIENVEVAGWKHAIRGARNLVNDCKTSDSGICKGGENGIGCKRCANEKKCTHAYDHSWQLGKADYKLMMELSSDDSVHAKYRKLIVVYLDITAPVYWWKDFDTCKIIEDGIIQWKHTVMLNYEMLAEFYPIWKEYELGEWRDFCRWIEQLPYSELIIGRKG